MKAEDLLEIIGEIDDSVIQEAKRKQGRILRKQYAKWGVAAAGLLIIALVAYTFGRKGNIIEDSTKTTEKTASESESMTETIGEILHREDIIVINQFRENPDNGGWFCISPDAFYMKNVTEISQKELPEYYELRADLDIVAADIISEIIGEAVTCSPYSSYFFPLGVYRDEEYVYDRNTLRFWNRETNDDHDEFKYVNMSFSKSTNIPWPGSRTLLEDYSGPFGSLESRFIKSDYEASQFNGHELFIGQVEEYLGNEWQTVESTYLVFTKLDGIEVSIEAYNLSKEQIVELMKRILSTNWRNE